MSERSVVRVAQAFQGIANPLTNMGLLLQTVERALCAAVARDRESGLDRALAATNQISRILDHLQVLARSAANIAREAEPVGRVSVQEAAAFAAQLAMHRIRQVAELELDLRDSSFVLACRSELTQALVHLLLHAANAIPEGTDGAVIKLSTACEADGTGTVDVLVTRVAGDDIELDMTAAGDLQSLALSMCYRTVRDLDGRLNIELSPELGARFEIKLPAASM